MGSGGGRGSRGGLAVDAGLATWRDAAGGAGRAAAAGGGGGDRAAAAPGLGEGQSGDVRWVTAEPAAGGEGLRQPGHPAVP